jgi:hypothetical protein
VSGFGAYPWHESQVGPVIRCPVQQNSLCSILSLLFFHNVFFSKDLVKVHRSLMQEIHDSIVNKDDQNLYQVFINYKER